MCNFLEHSAGVLINSSNNKNKLGQENSKISWCVCFGGQGRTRFGKKKRCVSKGKKEGFSVENREEGVGDREQVIPESSTVQIKYFKLKKLIFSASQLVKLEAHLSEF